MFSLYHKAIKNQGVSLVYHQFRRNCNSPFARCATSLMRSITSLRSTSFATCRNLVHLYRTNEKWCFRYAQNDVGTFGRNEKIQVFRLGFFGSPCWACFSAEKPRRENAFAVFRIRLSSPAHIIRNKRKTDRGCGLLFFGSPNWARTRF